MQTTAKPTMQASSETPAAPRVSTHDYYPKGKTNLRIFALWYFGSLITLWNIFGHTVLGFEQSWAAPVVSVGVACICQIVLEVVDAWANKRKLRFLSSTGEFATFFVPAIISGCAIGMLLYPNETLMPFVFASVFAIGSKVLFRAPHKSGTQHFLNPSNAGIAATLLLFPSVGAAPPYHFMENANWLLNWVMPVFILGTGIFVHGIATGRLPLVGTWMLVFMAQAYIRSLIFGTPVAIGLLPMTSTGFIIFTLYMIPDPATTPIKTSRQILFGASVAVLYGILQITHVVYGLFIALVAISTIRGLALWILKFTGKLDEQKPEQRKSLPVKREMAATR